MDRSPISRADAVAGLRARLFLPDAVAEGFDPVELVDPGGDELRLLFRWHGDRKTYVRLLPVGPDDLASSWLTGERVPAEVWVDEVRLQLTEDLETGFVRRAVRRLDQDGIVLLEPPVGTDHRRDVYYTSDVPLLQPIRSWQRGPRVTSRRRRGSFVLLGGTDHDTRDWEFDPHLGSWLADIGLEVRAARRLVADGRLLSWKQLCEDTASAPTVGHAVGGWEPGRRGVARLEVAETLGGVPEEALHQLIASVCHDAADAGAAEVVTGLKGPAVLATGFVPATVGDDLRLDLREP